MYLPASISNKAIVSYIVALMLVTIIFHQYATQWYFMLFGIVEVVGFYHYGNVLSKQYSNYSEKYFRSQIFKTALVIRVVYVLFSYLFYDFMTGRPFEFGMADAEFYHQSAEGVATLFWDGDFNFMRLFNGTDVSDVGYPLYLGIVYAITDNSILIARLLKALMSAYMCVLIYNIAKRNFGESVGRLSAIFVMLCPNLIYYCGMHLKETEMVFISMFALDKIDEVLHVGRFTFKNFVVPALLTLYTFMFRTVLGLAILFAIGVTVLLADNRVVSKSRKILVMTIIGLMSVLFLWSYIKPVVQELWLKKDAQKTNMEWRSEREHGNQFAKYAGATVFAPLIFSLPFPTMVEIETQEDQQMVNGNNFVKNILSFFTIFSLFLIVFKKKSWRRYIFIIAYMVIYLGFLVFSEFAHSERFHLPALPIEMIFAAFGVSQITLKTKKIFDVWSAFMIAVVIVWNWFKLAGRNMI